jgi:hypothetical protein
MTTAVRIRISSFVVMLVVAVVVVVVCVRRTYTCRMKVYKIMLRMRRRR